MYRYCMEMAVYVVVFSVSETVTVVSAYEQQLTYLRIFDTSLLLLFTLPSGKLLCPMTQLQYSFSLSDPSQRERLRKS